jgi:hypothetical protein
MGDEIDPVEFGKLLQSVSSLTEKVDTLTAKVSALESTLTGGKGLIAGLMVAAGGIGASAKQVMEHLFK